MLPDADRARRLVAALLIGGVGVACTPAPSLVTDAPLAAPRETAIVTDGPRPSGTPSPRGAEVTPTPPPLADALPRPGRPYGAADILALMRASRRPGGVPDEMETERIARSVAALVWTLDGDPWTTTSAGGSCGPVRCTLEIGGARQGWAGDDLMTFEVIPAGAQVAVLAAELRSMPSEVVMLLDSAARKADSRIGAEVLLTSARWLPPPAEDTFELSYRSGDEEGSCELEVRLDARSGDVEVQAGAAC